MAKNQEFDSLIKFNQNELRKLKEELQNLNTLNNNLQIDLTKKNEEIISLKQIINKEKEKLREEFQKEKDELNKKIQYITNELENQKKNEKNFKEQIEKEKMEFKNKENNLLRMLEK